MKLTIKPGNPVNLYFISKTIKPGNLSRLKYKENALNNH